MKQAVALLTATVAMADQHSSSPSDNKMLRLLSKQKHQQVLWREASTPQQDEDDDHRDGDGTCSGFDPPAEACFYKLAYYEFDGSACADAWHEFEGFCERCYEKGDDGLCDKIITDYLNAVGEIVPGVAYPGEECCYKDAFVQEEDSKCAYKWEEFESFCEGNREQFPQCHEIWLTCHN